MEEYDFSLEEYSIGPASGPSIVITAAIHGDEQTATHAARLVWGRLQGLPLQGRVTILPLCNRAAAQNRTRFAPQDGLDLNRTFPGAAAGSYSLQLAAHIWQKTQGYDYLLDLHCCGLYGATYTMAWYCRHSFAKELCRALGFGTVIHTRGIRRQLYIEAAEQRGQKALLVELPGGQPGGVVDEQAAIACADRVMGYLTYIGILGGPATPAGEVRFCGIIDGGPRAQGPGLCRAMVRPGDYVSAGQAVCLLDGAEIAAPFDAVITSAVPMRYVFAGETLVSLAPRAEIEPGAIECREPQ